LPAVFTILGNAVGVLWWGLAAALGISALVAASELAYGALRVGGAVVLVWIGVGTLLRARRDRRAPPGVEPGGRLSDRHAARSRRASFRLGVLTGLANPKLAAFFVALFPQFVPAGAPVLPWAVGMALTIIALDLVWYSLVATVVARASRAVLGAAWVARVEQLMGAVLVGLGVRLALERR
jgi:threonine/homoserine/homoserine lactone efflux protein